MSKESYIGGDYIETTGGDNRSFAKENIVNSSGTQFRQEGTDGVTYGTNKDPVNITAAAVLDAYVARLEDKTYTKISSATVGDTVYIVVKTAGLAGKKIEVNLKDRDGILSDKPYGVVDLMQDDKDVQGLLTATVDKEGLAVYKVKLQPSMNKKDIEAWGTKINNIKDKKVNTCILVDAGKHNPGVEITYMGKNAKEQEKDSQTSSLSNYWLDQNGKWFEIKYCLCCSYIIEKGLLNGANVIHSKTGSKVKSTGSMQKDIKAIVLHRTAGYTTTGAVTHTKGTHFYVDGPRGNDGEIFQPFALDKSSSHIRSSTDKTRIARKDIENDNSIGIEVIGMNYSKDKKGNWKNKPSADKKITKGYKDVDGEHYWDELSVKQINSVVCIVKKLLEKYGLSKTDILLHEDIQQKTGGEGRAVYDSIISKL